MKKQVLSVALALAMTTSYLGPVAAAADQPQYLDINGHWAQPAITRWSEYGIVRGHDGIFRPDDNITRGELAVILDRLMQYQSTVPNTFEDLTDAYYHDAILRLNAAGVMVGDDNKVRPVDSVTRQEAAVMVARALGLSSSNATTLFVDDAAIAAWAKEAVGALQNKGWVNGRGDNQFDPMAAITRAELVTLLDNGIALLVQAGDVVTDQTVEGTVLVNSTDVALSGLTVGGNQIFSPLPLLNDYTLDDVSVGGRLILMGTYVQPQVTFTIPPSAKSLPPMFRAISSWIPVTPSSKT